MTAGCFLYGVALAAGDPVNAEVELRRALELGATANQVVPLLARALVEQGKAAAMVAQFGKSELADPTAAANLKLQIADVLLADNQWDDADAAALAALVSVPNNPLAVVMRARQVGKGRRGRCDCFGGPVAQVRASQCPRLGSQR